MFYKKKSFLIIVFFIIVNLIAGYFSLKPYFNPNASIGHADQANLANLAQNISEGKGFVVDNVWIHTNGGMPGNSVTHPEVYWSVYVAAIVAIFFKIFEVTRLYLVLPALIFKIITTALISQVIWKHSSNSLIKTITTIIVVTFSPLLLYSVSGLSDIYLTTAIVASTIYLTYGIIKNKYYYFAISGFIAGIGYGFKPSGLIIFGLLFCYFIIATNKTKSLKQISLFIIASLIAIAPYLYYNKTSYDTYTTPGMKLVVQAFQIRDHLVRTEKISPRVGHNIGLFNPSYPINTIASAELNTKEKLAVYYEYFVTFLYKGFINERLVSLLILPFVLFGIFMFIKEFRFNKKLTEPQIFQYFLCNLFLAGFLLSTQVFFEARYWNFYIPFVAYISIIYINKLKFILLTFIAAVTINNGYNFFHTSKWNIAPPQFAHIAKQIPKGESVFYGNPWQFAFYTRIPTVATPYTDNIEDFYKISEKYNTKYLVTINNDMRNKEFLPNNLNYFDLVFDKNNMKIYKLKPKQ